MTTTLPTSFDIIALANECGYHEYCPSKSFTLYFIEEETSLDDQGRPSSPLIKIHVYYTTRGIMTQLGDHPTQGPNQLWRSNAYKDIKDLKDYFINPRKHTGKGYRTADKAVRGCTNCGELKQRTDYTSNQWRKGPDTNRCKDCVVTVDVARKEAGSARSALGDDLTNQLNNLDIGGDMNSITNDSTTTGGKPRRTPDNTLIIKNLSDNTITEHHLTEMFQPYIDPPKSNLLGITINHHRGLAFVDFDSSDPVHAAVKQQAHSPFTWNGQVLVVEQKSVEQRARSDRKKATVTALATATATGGKGNQQQQQQLSLTSDVLEKHNKAESKKSKSSKNNIRNNDFERRQFNCPDCPKHGRHANVFYKKVPKYKPVVKCPVCKKVSSKKCRRLLAVPRDQERGYGMYKCHNKLCGQSGWGSSRALYGVGQECHGCRDLGVPDMMITPFRMEVPRKPGAKKYGKGKGGNVGDKPMVRVPREPIQEDEEVDDFDAAYNDDDERRYKSAASNALVPDAVSTKSYDYRESASSNSNSRDDVSTLSTPVSVKKQVYPHKCSKCVTGECKNRVVPKSKIHDRSDGDTASTRSSVVTNSSIDKSEYVDRDDDFNSFEVEIDDDHHNDFNNNSNNNDNTTSDHSWVEV
mmetsp:Transcript_56847/g.61624  ORF Transcript_56847/g.61624 Transcript_56847/m.61624 type:complete len:637 (+) Transcript_56847:118-2028(+)